MVYIVIATSFAIAGGLVGRLKGSSFWLWFLISGAIPLFGLIAAVFYRYDQDEPRRECPACGSLVMVHDAICTRCGSELDFPEESEILRPVVPGR